MRHEFTVDFDREVADDREFAEANFPDRSLPEQLKAQFYVELRENPVWNGAYAMVAATLEDGAETYTVRFHFEHRGKREHAKRIFREELQETYDRYGMAGSFHIHADKKRQGSKA